MGSYPNRTVPPRTPSDPRYVPSDYDLWDDYGNDPDYEDEDGSSVVPCQSNQISSSSVQRLSGAVQLVPSSTSAGNISPGGLKVLMPPASGNNYSRLDAADDFSSTPRDVTGTGFSNGSQDNSVDTGQIVDGFAWPATPHGSGLTSVSNQDYEQYSRTFDYSPTTPEHPHIVSQKKFEAQLANGMDFGLDTELVSPLLDSQLDNDSQILRTPSLAPHFNPNSHGDANGDSSLQHRQTIPNYGYNAYYASRTQQAKRPYSRTRQYHPYGLYYENGTGLPPSPQLSHGSNGELLTSPPIAQSPIVPYGGDGFGNFGNHPWFAQAPLQPPRAYPLPESLGNDLESPRSSVKKAKEEEKKAIKRLSPPEFVDSQEQTGAAFHMLNFRKRNAWKRNKKSNSLD